MATMIPISQIRRDAGTQMRAGLDAARVDDYQEQIDNLPPVKLVHDGTDYFLWDGFHTCAAHERAGRAEVPAEVQPGDVRKAILLACGANATHGLHRTNEDKRRAVQTLLDDAEWAAWSNRAIAEACGVSESMVRTMRPTAFETQSTSFETQSRRGRDGRVIETAAIGKRQAEPTTTQETPLPPYTGESGRRLLYPEEAPAQVLSSKPLRAAGGEHVDQTAGSVVFASAGPERGAAVGRSEDRAPGVGVLSNDPLPGEGLSQSRQQAVGDPGGSALCDRDLRGDIGVHGMGEGGRDAGADNNCAVPRLPGRGDVAEGSAVPLREEHGFQESVRSPGVRGLARGSSAGEGHHFPTALTEIAAVLGCTPELPEILSAIEALKAAAAQPGDGAAEWSALVESAQAWQVRAERAEAALSQVQEEIRDNTTLRTVPLPASEPTSDELGELRPGDPLVIKVGVAAAGTWGRRCLFAAFRRGSTQVIAAWCRPTTKWPRGAWDTVPLSKISRDPEPVDRVADLRALLAADPAERFRPDIERALAEAEGAVAVEQEPQDGGKKRRR